MAPTTQRRWLVTATIGGRSITRAFQGFSGGRKEVESTTTHPGGMAKPYTETSPGGYENITLSDLYDPVTDTAVEAWLDGQEGAVATVARQALDRQGNPIPGAHRTFTGKFVTASTPEVDAEGGDFNRWEWEFTVETAA